MKISANQKKLIKEIIPVEKKKKKKTQSELFEKKEKKEKKKGLTYKEKFNKKHKQPLNKSNSLKEISTLSGYELKGIKGIVKKGEAAFYSNPQSVRPQVKSATQWGVARAYSAVMGGKAARIDKDLLIKK